VCRIAAKVTAIENLTDSASLKWVQWKLNSKNGTGVVRRCRLQGSGFAVEQPKKSSRSWNTKTTQYFLEPTLAPTTHCRSFRNTLRMRAYHVSKLGVPEAFGWKLSHMAHDK
jgi:hypothetical protein